MKIDRSVETFAEEKGEFARLSSFEGGIAIGDLVKGTLGPKGMDKILVAHGRSAGQVEVEDSVSAKLLCQVGRRCRDTVEVIRGIEIKVFGSSIKMDSMVKIVEKEKMKEKVMIAEDTLLRFSGVPLGEACTDEADCSLHDALCVLAAETSGEESIAMEAFGLALL
ncbi:chaperonin [Culex quinquefasciatus]|uniref:Chaperonin n=1 Tax=Culex quinquefasciatus TaxID=7176 RepID=B0WHM4_CULQU|nr:chaperonin [Culex quinquefasciatus]|eukprot:XP_001848208.1 chaperonin [Culex quinquefasciatus]